MRFIGIMLMSIMFVLIHAAGNSSSVTTVFLPKPQGYYQHHYTRPYEDELIRCTQPCLGSITLAYYHSTHASAIAESLFGTTQLTVMGSQVPQRSSNALLADQFGLATDFVGSICFTPKIQYIALDFFYHISFPSWCEALFVEIGAPLVYAHWNLHTRTHITQQGSAFFPNAYMSRNPNPAKTPPTTTLDRTAPTITEAFSGHFLFGDMQSPWIYGKFPQGAQHRTRLADISLVLGAHLHCTDTLLLRAALLCIVPTGNKTDPKFLFTPTIGNGDHWELGFNVMSIFRLHGNDGHTLDLRMIGNLTHPFDEHSRRSFDFTGRGPLSRYLLLKQITHSDITQPPFQYNQTLINGINFATRSCEISIAIQGDFTVEARYTTPHSRLSWGYVLYGRTHEQIRAICTDAPADSAGTFYAIKGTQGAYYHTYGVSSGNITTEQLPPPHRSIAPKKQQLPPLEASMLLLP